MLGQTRPEGREVAVVVEGDEALGGPVVRDDVFLPRRDEEVDSESSESLGMVTRGRGNSRADPR